MLFPRVLAVVMFGTALASPLTAGANGRYPAAGQLIQGPDDADTLLLRATFGFAVSKDGGASFRWICEEAIGFSGVLDPAVAYAGGNVPLASLANGLSVSTDDGCSWKLAGDPLAGEYLLDVSAERIDPSRVLAITTTPGNAGNLSIVARSTDSGQSWVALGPPLGADFRALTVDSAPSNPQRIYVSGLVEPAYTPTIVRSTDGGASWERIEHSDLAGAPFIGAVDPLDEEVLYVRTVVTAGDRLYRSEDGGTTFDEVLVGSGQMLGFALSPGGDQVAVGGPMMGLKVASTSNMAFVDASSVGVRCLTWTADWLYLCADEARDGFTLGRSGDVGVTVEPLFHLADLSPLACPEGTPTQELCPALWPGVASLLGIDTSSTSASASTTGDGDDGGQDSDDASGCSCRTKRGPSREGVLLGLGLVGILFVRRLRRH